MFSLLIVFCAAVLESSVIPIFPMEIILAPLVLASPENALFFILLTTAGSVIGSIIGLTIGKWKAEEIITWLVGEERFKWTEKVFEKHGIFGLALASITPIPYTLFTITSGAYDTSYRTVFLIALFGRGFKFTLEIAALVWLTTLEPTVALLVLGGGLGFGYLSWHYYLEDILKNFLVSDWKARIS